MLRVWLSSVICVLFGLLPAGSLVGADRKEYVPIESRPMADRSSRPGEYEAAESSLIKGIYCSFYTLGHRGLRTHVMRLIAETEINAVVMDVKGDRGFLPYLSKVPMVSEVGAQDQIMVREWEPFIRSFTERGVYTIARIVTFKDDLLARAHPEWAVRDALTGGLWRDREELAWSDPFRKEVWEYNIAIAVEAVQKGFDEIQFDYVRFPSDGHVKSARFSKGNEEKQRREAITGFLRRAHQALEPLGAKVAADVFGYTTWRYDDTGIGQKIEDLAPYLDVLCPMLYPSSFHAGIPGYPLAVKHPYQIVFQSTKKAVERVAGYGVSVRPWLQDFRDYAFDHRVFTSKEIREQMQGALDGGSKGWMLWDPRVRYTSGALARTEVVDRAPSQSNRALRYPD